MSEFTIETFKPIYREEIINLILEIQSEEFGIEISRKDQPDLENIERFYQSGNGNFGVAKFGN